MKRLVNLKFLSVLLLGAGVIFAFSSFLKEDEAETTYGEPDGEESSGEVSSFVD